MQSLLKSELKEEPAFSETSDSFQFIRTNSTKSYSTTHSITEDRVLFDPVSYSKKRNQLLLLIQKTKLLLSLTNTNNSKTLAYLANLHARISDTKSRVLVTGDLNAGKSTFINTLLGRPIVPDDQQPCTALFCEVISKAENMNREEVHGIPHENIEKYDISDPSSFTVCDIRDLREIVEDNEQNWDLVKVYCDDDRVDGESILRNGVVDISLIDSPGLNIDMMKTLSLFAKQETIDVVIFVVNAENHFTLSGREFLTKAGKEKAYIFIVVNKFDTICRKDRCRNEILSQIKEISPQTYAERSSLVHFVSARQRLEYSLHKKEHPDEPAPQINGQSYLNEFNHLEECLRSFIFEKRLRSKLLPAKHYIVNLLNELEESLTAQKQTLESQKITLTETIHVQEPILKNLETLQQNLEDMDSKIHSVIGQIEVAVKKQLDAFLNDIQKIDTEWRGFLGGWEYAKRLRNRVFEEAGKRIKLCENFAKHKALNLVLKLEEDIKAMEVDVKLDFSLLESGFLGSVAPSGSKTNVDGIEPVARAAEPSTNGYTAKSEKTKPTKLSAPVIPLEITEYFEYEDKLELAKEYIPSVSMFVGGLIGYQSYAAKGTMTVSRMDRGIWGQTKLVFAGLTIAGIGLFLYSISNIQVTISKLILSKTHAQLSASPFIQSTTNHLINSTKQVMNIIFWDLRNQVGKLVRDAEGRKRMVEKEVRGVEENQKRVLQGLKGVEEIRKELAAVDLEE
ncbi:mitofusin [Nowakowskiella sp. JEL0407]|nr:mitofusin [Nowakowskiella sp. JEL0407]